MRIRALLLFLFLASSLSLILLRLFDLQIRQHRRLSADAIRQQERQIPAPSKRGSICDRNGKELAVSLRSYSFFAHPSLVEDRSRTSAKVAAALGLSQQEVYRKLESGKPFVWIQRKVDPEVARGLLREKLPGIYSLEENKRYYPKGELASHVLGFVGLDDRGLEGLEFSHDFYLSGSPGRPRGYCDALGRIAFREAEADVTLEGCDLILTLDEVIQYFAERALEKGVNASQAKGGSILVMDPSSGEILAMADRPTFHPRDYRNYPPAFRRNRPIADCYEPGSTFKVIMAAGVLEEGLVRPEEKIYCEMGGISLNKFYIRDYKKYGWLTFSQVLENSSNVGAIKAASRLGKERYYEYIKRFGFGARTGIELPGEAEGILRKPKDWSSLSLGAVAMGQEISVTPLQLLTAFCAIGNGGELLRPYLIRAIRGPHGEILRENSPQRLRRVISPSTASQLTQILVKAVEEGTGRNAAVPGYPVAGKTGTSQKIDHRTGQYSHEKVIASFVGFVPAHSPQLAILVTIDEPKVSSWGGAIAAPVFAEVAQKSLHYLKMRSLEEGSIPETGR
ncbi:MAG: penicillin-binding transpeptidase domain-containing protein [candidate division NC10 bacterium]|nr:penicillin-binding transpeptidase domain-containing protein [candidate division NC10 bacterium]